MNRGAWRDDDIVTPRPTALRLIQPQRVVLNMAKTQESLVGRETPR